MDFTRAILVERSLIASVEEWQRSGSSLAELDVDILKRQASIASLDRTIVAMSELRNNHKDELAGKELSAESVSGAGQIQVQVNGPAFLPQISRS